MHVTDFYNIHVPVQLLEQWVHTYHALGNPTCGIYWDAYLGPNLHFWRALVQK